MLNPDLVAVQGLDLAAIDSLNAMHRDMKQLLARYRPDLSATKIRLLNRKVERLEFSMQEAWGFQKSAAYHTHWQRAPGCDCPRPTKYTIDHSYRFVSPRCPYHSGEPRDEITVFVTT